MKAKNEKKIWKVVFTTLVAISVIFAFILFIQDNSRRATTISVKSLRDSTTLNAQRIDEIFDRCQNEISLLASLYEETLVDFEVNAEDLKAFTEESSFGYVEFADVNGIEMNGEGKTADVSDRYYYQEGMKGNCGVDVVFNSRITNENLIVFYAPLYYNGRIMGVLVGDYKTSQMEEILYNTFFDEDSRTFLCMKDGTVIASWNKGYFTENIFENESFNDGLGDGVEEELRNALLTGEEYEFQYDGTKGTGNAYVTPLSNSEWVLIQTFPSQVTAQLIQDANWAGIRLLAMLIVIFAICLIVAQVVNSQQKKKIILENIEKTYVVDGITQLYKKFVLVDLEQGTYKYLAGTKPRNHYLSECGKYNSFKKYIVDFVEDEDERKSLDTMLTKEMLQKNLDKDVTHLRCEYRSKIEKGKWDGLNLICLKRVDDIPIEVLFTYQDVTTVKEREQRNYEALKEAYQAVESANQAKSNFLSNMSHDIRTPMNAIMGMTAIAAMNIDNPERMKDCLNKITASSQHLLSLINEVLDMSKIESGKMIFAEEEFNLSDVVENIVTMFLPQTQAKNQHFNVNITEITHEEVIGDSTRLQQVFVNILGNAVKFTPEGGEITFNICEKPSGLKGCGRYVFTFEDTGIGMEESYMGKLFEPFVRADNSRTGKIEGTGLGMPIVKNIVQLMNGDIQVESKLNEGSKFTVTLYLRLNRSRRDDVEGLEKLSVLVADDEQIACESACGMLRDIGMQADFVLSGEAAIEKLVTAYNECKGYAAVILDWKMPGMDGVETAREIRAKIGEEVPIIILSAYDYTDIEQEARAAGVNAFISKPLFRSRLIYVMKSLIQDNVEEYTEIEQLKGKDYSGKRVLIVDDIEINLEIAEELLKETGITVEKAVNGGMAVERVKAMPAGYYDLVFMDIQMPEMNGYEATAAIRTSGREDLKTLPIVAMSADAFMDDVKHAQDVGMNGHIAKPVEIGNLLKALEEWILEQ